MVYFNIIDYLSGLSGFIFDKSVLARIARDRNVLGVTEYETLTAEDKDLLLADLLFVVYTGANSSASLTNQHGAFTKTIGSQTINDKKGIYNIMIGLYQKWGDPKAEVVLGSGGTLQWM